MYDLLKHGVNVEKYVITKERYFPNDDHWNPKSEKYIHSE